MTYDVVGAISVVFERVSHYAPLHAANIAAHVVFGSIGLILGAAQFLTKKGGPVHRALGRLFLASFSVVIVSAAIGSVLRFQPFLAVITLLAAYAAISGVRTLRVRRNGLAGIDIVLAIVGLAAVAAFVVAIERYNYPWDRTVIYSTLGALALLSGYDLVRAAFPRRVFETTWIYEHIYKMTSAFSALASAALGTVFPDFQPASQLGPSVAGVGIMLFFALRASGYSDLARK